MWLVSISRRERKNHIRVILIDRAAWLYVNDRRMGILNFSLGDIPAPDWVGLVVDDFDGQGFRYSKGGSTKFEDFNRSGIGTRLYLSCRRTTRRGNGGIYKEGIAIERKKSV